PMDPAATTEYSSPNMRTAFSLSKFTPRHYLSIGKRDLNRGITWHHAKPVLSKMKISDYFGPQHAHDIRGGGRAAAGSDFFRHTTAAYHMSAFEDERRQSSPR